MIRVSCARDSSVSVSGVMAGFCELCTDYLGCQSRECQVLRIVRLQYNLSQFPKAYQHVCTLGYWTYAFRRSFSADVSVSSVSSVIKG